MTGVQTCALPICVPDIYVDEDNGWTIYTDDDEPSAQWEIMVLVTDTGYEVMSW